VTTTKAKRKPEEREVTSVSSLLCTPIIIYTVPGTWYQVVFDSIRYKQRNWDEQQPRPRTQEHHCCVHSNNAAIGSYCGTRNLCASYYISQGRSQPVLSPYSLTNVELVSTIASCASFLRWSTAVLAYNDAFD